MAAKTRKNRGYCKPKNDGERAVAAEERAARIEGLNAELVAAVESLSSSAAWRSMLEVSARFRRYSFNNQILLWCQAEAREMTLTRVAAFGTWKKLGYRIITGSKGFRIFGPLKSRLRPNEIAEWQGKGQNPFGPDSKPRMVVRGFKVETVFDRSQVEPTEDAQPIDDGREWISQEGNGPEGLWDQIVSGIDAAGFTLELRPSVAADKKAHGWTDYQRRIVWINELCDEAERIRIGAHELWGHIRSDHKSRDISKAQGETEADSVAFVVLAALGLRIDSSSVEYIAGWSGGKADVLREAGETVRRVSAAVLAELEEEG